ncbi:MAG: hypothetical protein DYH05_13750 [Acidobacteria bacterium ACB1]|nr:hypothetical protein [Acidobacteria bacterium ACB1]
MLRQDTERSELSRQRNTSFDILGRVTGHRQTTGGTAYSTAYTYDLSGALIEETYPSGRKVKNTLDANGVLSLVETMPSGGSYQTRANNFTYNAAGAVTSMQLGNGNWESTQFNPRRLDGKISGRLRLDRVRVIIVKVWIKRILG